MMEIILGMLNKLPDDKVRHVLVGVMGAAVTCSVLLLLGRPAWLSCLGAVALVSFSAAIKELYDSTHPPHECNFYDWIATVIGGLLPLLPILLH